MAVGLHLNFGLKATFELKGEVIIINSDALGQFTYQPFIVVRHRLLVLFQKGFELVQPLLHSDAVGILAASLFHS